MRTLLVEDDAAQRTRLHTVLAELGLEVESHERAERALMEHARQPFDLFVIDWVLPEMDGLQLCRKIRSMPGGDKPYVLVVTGRDAPEDLAAVLDAGADDYIAKPLHVALLQTRVRIALRRLASDARHRAAQEALARSEADFGRVIERSPLGVVAERAGVIVYANAAAGRTFGTSPRALCGTAMVDLAQPEYRHVVARRSARFERTQVPPPAMEMDLRRVDGGVCVVRCIPATSAVYQGQRALFTILEDITQQRQLQASLQQADRLASVGSMAAGVAHEINNPLAYAITNLELMQEALQAAGDRVDPALRKRLSQIIVDALDGSERVRRIVGDLKRFSRTEEDEPDRAVDVHGVLDVAVDISRSEIKHRACLVRAFDEVPAIRGNEGRLTQVFVNLLVNAAHAITEDKEDGRIELSTTVGDEGTVDIVVRDNGEGIPSEIIDRIFDPFFTTKPQGMGTGLGLSICHGIVTKLGGRLAVQSKMGEGTEVTVSLPPDLQADSGVARKATRVHSANTPAMRILVVDDEPLVCEGIKRALRAHEVTITSSGRDAVELCESAEFDLVLCDVMMPEVSGMDVYSRVRRERPEMTQRFVFMTGGAFTASARAFLESIDNEQIIKPFSLRELRSLVARRSESTSPLARH
ncbi:MAG: response regulator [Nannocystaceae bacterium]|nr:response regulator [bacterium]